MVSGRRRRRRQGETIRESAQGATDEATRLLSMKGATATGDDCISQRVSRAGRKLSQYEGHHLEPEAGGKGNQCAKRRLREDRTEECKSKKARKCGSKEQKKECGSKKKKDGDLLTRWREQRNGTGEAAGERKKATRHRGLSQRGLGWYCRRMGPVTGLQIYHGHRGDLPGWECWGVVSVR